MLNSKQKNPDFTCPACNLAGFIEEFGYAGDHDDEPIECPNCGMHLGTFSSTGPHC
jgi:rubrerythrin